MELYDINKIYTEWKIITILLITIEIAIVILYISSLIKINIYLPKINKLLSKIEKNTNSDVIEENRENEIKEKKNFEFPIWVSITMIIIIIIAIIISSKI